MTSETRIYWFIISTIGLGLGVLGLVQTVPVNVTPMLILLLTLALAQGCLGTVSRNGVSLDFSTAFALAAVPLWGVGAAVVVSMAGNLCVNFISAYRNKRSWKTVAERLSFNLGMASASAFSGGIVLLLLRTSVESNVLWQNLVAWMLAALAADQVNLLILTHMLRLVTGEPTLKLWQDNMWAIPVNVMTTAVGGSAILLAMETASSIAVFTVAIALFATGAIFYRHINRIMAHDIRLQQIVKQRTQHLEDALTGRNVILQVVSEDMRSLLEQIRKRAIYLVEDEEISEQEQEAAALDILRREHDLLEVVDNILDMEEISVTTGLELRRESVDVQALVTRVLDSYRSRAEEKGLEFVCSLSHSGVSLLADYERLRMALQSLISNAVKYSPEGGRIEVRVARQGEMTHIYVSNEGEGIEDEERENVFKRFYRLPRHQGRVRGAGLGLTVARAMVEAHGGQIWVEQANEDGVTFVMELPHIIATFPELQA